MWKKRRIKKILSQLIILRKKIKNGTKIQTTYCKEIQKNNKKKQSMKKLQKSLQTLWTINFEEKFSHIFWTNQQCKSSDINSVVKISTSFFGMVNSAHSSAINLFIDLKETCGKQKIPQTRRQHMLWLEIANLSLKTIFKYNMN